jgi:TRAP-type mannitol/chloroaromatic compound transport system permease small subunit
MPEEPKISVDVAETLEELHHVSYVSELNTSGKDAGPLGQVHPIGWGALGLLVLAVIFHIKGSDWLIGNFSWWHWVGLILLAALALRPEPIKAVSRFIDRVTDFFEDGANSFAHPRAALVTIVTIIGLVGLFVGPLVSVADWIFGVDVEPVGTSEFMVTSSTAGWVRSIVAGVVLVALFAGMYRALKRALPEGEISIVAGTSFGLATFVITFLVVWAASGWQTGVTTGFALGILATGIAIGPLWVMAWGIFVVIFFYVVTRYSARFIQADIIIGEVNSLGLQLFGLLALLGVGYGVKAGVNPRIDFWWAEFSNRRKAWLDLVLHSLLFLPFLWASLRLLHSYAKTNLGYNKDFSGATNGDWPASWHVWETWSQAPDAGNLPAGPVKAMIFVGFILFFTQIFSEMIKGGFVLIHREDLAELKRVDAPTRVE